MKQQEKIKMSFVCDQKWSEMTPTHTGGFCNACQKEVVDFSNYKLKEIHLKLKKQPGLCGRYNIEHVDPDIIAPISIPFKEKIIAYLASMLLLFTVRPTTAQAIYPKIEQYSTFHDKQGIPEVQKKENKSQSCEQEKEHDNDKKNNYNRKRRRGKFYLSSKFPFLIFRKKRRFKGRRAYMGF